MSSSRPGMPLKAGGKARPAAERRRKVNKEPPDRKPGSWLILAGLVILLAGSAALLWHNLDQVKAGISQPVVNVHIENPGYGVSEIEVLALIDSYLGTGFFDLDVHAVRKELENHPWIRGAAVKKVWPDRLWLRVTEEVAIAHWRDSQLLNQYGETFRPGSSDHLPDLPYLSGPAATQMKVMEQFHVMSRLLYQAGLRVTSLSLGEQGNWTLMLSNQIQIKVGRVEVINRLQRFMEFYRRQSAGPWPGIVAVDLRYNNGIAVRHRVGVQSGPCGWVNGEHNNTGCELVTGSTAGEFRS